MPNSNNGKIKLLGAAWLVSGGLSFVFVSIAIFPLALGDAPSETEVADGYWVFILLGLVMAAVGTVNGSALLRRYRVARPLLAVSSLGSSYFRRWGPSFPFWWWYPSSGSRSQEVARRHLRAIQQGRIAHAVTGVLAQSSRGRENAASTLPLFAAPALADPTYAIYHCHSA